MWTGTATDRDSKKFWLRGGRTLGRDRHRAAANRVQITIDGHSAYLEAVEGAFDGDVDFAQLVKLYGKPICKKDYERKYPPSECVGNSKRFVTGDSERAHISTSYVERNNLTMRTGMRRFTRLANVFSKQLANRLAT